MRITRLRIKRPIYNRFIYWLYDKFVSEPYMPDGRFSVLVNRKGVANESQHVIKIGIVPKKFVAGIHEWHLFDGLNAEITFMEDLLK